jgi:hypothetical protein
MEERQEVGARGWCFITAAFNITIKYIMACSKEPESIATRKSQFGFRINARIALWQGYPLAIPAGA